MSPDNSEMRPEYDMRGGVRGKYFTRYQQWAGITAATGPVPTTVTTSGSSAKHKIVREIDYVAFARSTSGATEAVPTLVR